METPMAFEPQGQTRRHDQHYAAVLRAEASSDVATDSNGTVWTLDCEREDHGDCIKIISFAVNDNGQRKHLGHSPYEAISPEAFNAHVSGDFPERGSQPWRNNTIVAAVSALLTEGVS